MGIQAWFRELFGQAAAETGVAEPHKKRPADEPCQQETIEEPFFPQRSSTAPSPVGRTKTFRWYQGR